MNPSMASASDQTLPLPLPAPSNPNQIHTPTAPLPLPLPLPEEDDPTPTPPPPPPPSSSAARKLPIKRRSPPPRPSSSPSSSGPASSGADPLKNQNPAFKFQRIWSESDELRFLQGLLGCGAQGLLFPRDLNVFYDRFSESMPQPYTRSQLSEKLRRLKNKHRGVAARVAKGLDPARLAPHDRDVLHLCSRLWDPANAANSPFAAPTTTTTTAGAGSSSGNNKRRRANNPHQGQGGGADLPAPSGDSYNGGISGSSAPGAAAFLDENGEMYLEQQSGGHNLYFVEGGGVSLVADCNLDGIPMEQQPEPPVAAAFTNIIAADNGLAPPFTNNIAPDDELPASFTNIAAADNGAAAAFTTNIAADNGLVATAVPNIFVSNNTNNNMVDNCKVALPRSDDHRLASAVLDIFEECMREAKADGTICAANANESELAKRWRQQRMDELDVLSRRLRLIVEDAAPAGH